MQIWSEQNMSGECVIPSVALPPKSLLKKRHELHKPKPKPCCVVATTYIPATFRYTWKSVRFVQGMWKQNFFMIHPM
jgi:hypothetical protein